MTEDKRARLEEIISTDPSLSLLRTMDEMEKDGMAPLGMAKASRKIWRDYSGSDYQRRHRKWALIEARIKRDDVSVLEAQKCLFETSAEAAEQRVHELEAQRDKLREALAQIANHPHNAYDHPENGGGQYGIGCADGHRCAADIARAVLEEKP